MSANLNELRIAEDNENVKYVMARHYMAANHGSTSRVLKRFPHPVGEGAL